MPDVEARITLTTVGGDAAASEIRKGSDAINQITTASSGMQAKFQERFQHVGLRLFAGDALRTIGLSGEARMAINMMNMALTGAEEAAGIASGGVTLFITALVALGAAIYKVIEYQKSHRDELEKHVDAEQKASQSTQDGIKILENYSTAVGGLTPKQKELYNAELDLAQLQKTELLESIRKQIGAIQQQMQANILHAQVMQTVKQAYEGIVDGAKKYLEQLSILYPELAIIIEAAKLLKEGVQALTNEFKNHIGQTTLSTKATKDLNAAQDPLIAKLKSLQVELTIGGAKWQDYFKKATEASDKIAKEEKKNADEIQAAIDEELARRRRAYESYTKSIEALDDEALKEQNKAIAKQVAAVKAGAKMMGDDFAHMASGIILDQQNIGEAVGQMMHQMAEQFIQKVIEMIFEWMALRAVMSILPGGAAAYQGAAQAAYPALAQATYNSTTTSHALGGSVFADQPTMAIFGEGGPEVATFTPLSGSGGGGGGSGGNTYFGDINITVQGVNDPDEIAQKVGLKIIQQIRGQGQVNFTR